MAYNHMAHALLLIGIQTVKLNDYFNSGLFPAVSLSSNNGEYM